MYTCVKYISEADARTECEGVNINPCHHVYTLGILNDSLGRCVDQETTGYVSASAEADAIHE